MFYMLSSVKNKAALFCLALTFGMGSSAVSAEKIDVSSALLLETEQNKDGVERVLILDESFPEASVAPSENTKRAGAPALKVKAIEEKKPVVESKKVEAAKKEAAPSSGPVAKKEEKAEELTLAKASSEVKKPSVPESATVAEPAQRHPSDYEIMSGMQRSLMVLQMQEKIVAAQTRIDKQHAEQSKLQKESQMDELMNFRLGPPGKGGMALPVFSSSPMPEPAPRPSSRNTGDNSEPPLRVVGIQGYDGVFTAQILNNGGLTSVEAGTELEGGVTILSINESGVKVRKLIEKDGQKKEEDITLPFSR